MPVTYGEPRKPHDESTGSGSSLKAFIALRFRGRGAPSLLASSIFFSPNCPNVKSRPPQKWLKTAQSPEAGPDLDPFATEGDCGGGVLRAHSPLGLPSPFFLQLGYRAHCVRRERSGVSSQERADERSAGSLKDDSGGRGQNSGRSGRRRGGEERGGGRWVQRAGPAVATGADTPPPPSLAPFHDQLHASLAPPHIAAAPAASFPLLRPTLHAPVQRSGRS